MYGFPKSERENITDDELKGFKKLANIMLDYTAKQLQAAVQAGALTEVIFDE